MSLYQQSKPLNMHTQKKKDAPQICRYQPLEENPPPRRFKINWMNLQHAETGKTSGLVQMGLLVFCTCRGA